MIKFENPEVWGFEHAIRGMRNPMNSWNRSDSEFRCDDLLYNCEFCRYGDTGCDPIGSVYIGENDLNLMTRLIKNGSTHRKFLRQIFVSVDITAPLYWWKEFDTYKIGTTTNSCSTMHKIHAKKFTLDDFSCEHLFDSSMCEMESVIERMNFWRTKFIIQSNKETADENYATAKQCWWQMIQLLPSSYNQKRTVTMTYENLLNMYESRRGHKLDEWRWFCEWIFTLPYTTVLKEGVTNEQS